jgi:hypothetical protein
MVTLAELLGRNRVADEDDRTFTPGFSAAPSSPAARVGPLIASVAASILVTRWSVEGLP